MEDFWAEMQRLSPDLKIQFKDYKTALNLLEKAIAQNPQQPRAWYQKGLMLQKLERYEEAIAANEKSLTLIEVLKKFSQTPENLACKPLLKTSQQWELEKQWFEQGYQLQLLGKLEDAVMSFNQVLEINPTCYEAWSNRGVALNDLNRHEEAIFSFEKVLAIKPDCPEGWNNLGIALNNLTCYEDAITSYKKALKIKPDYSESWHNQGISLTNLKCYKEAVISYDKALEIEPTYYDAWNARGIVLCDSLAQYEEAIISFNKALELKQNDHEVWTNRGLTLNKLNRYEEAVFDCEQALKIKPDFPEAWDSRGVALAFLNRYEESIASFDKALEINPAFHEAWSNRGGILCDHLKQYEIAIISFDKALAIKLDSCNAWYNRSIAALLSLTQSQTPVLGVETTLSKQHPELNKRGYSGQVITLEFGITQIAQRSEGWGVLQRALSNAHFTQGKMEQYQGHDPTFYWQKARHCLDLALSVFPKETSPQLRLQTLELMIRVLLAQGENASAQAHRKAGVELLHTLLNQAPTNDQKQRIEAQFSGFSQIEVDVWLQTGEPITALKTAERFKNRCLTSILEAWKEIVISPSHATMQNLCTPNTAIVYWHLSPDSLATFILIDGSNNPEVLPSNRTAQAQQLTIWLQDWKKDYRDYAGKKLTQTESENHPWRQNLQSRLTRLREILQIETICQNLPNTIQNLILIPHQDLHLLPLHTFFPDHLSCTYLPSAQIGITLQKQPSQPQIYTPLLGIEDPKTEQDPMHFAQLESAIVRHLVKPSTPISGEQATTATVLHNLKQPFATLHFTGHSAYNARTPKASALALALADGLLTAETIAQQDLSSYRLIILSACETALTGNDGIKTEYVGLASAFLKAGATNILSTLWPVDEISSTWLIIQFYQFLLAGDPPRIALKHAQQWLRDETWEGLANWIAELSKLPGLQEGVDPLIARAENTRKEGTIMGLNQPTKYSHPYHWAAFTLTGRG